MMVGPGTGVENVAPNPKKRRFSQVGGKEAQQHLEKRILAHADPRVLKDTTKSTQLSHLEAEYTVVLCTHGTREQTSCSPGMCPGGEVEVEVTTEASFLLIVLLLVP
jgi:hypothetical protein